MILKTQLSIFYIGSEIGDIEAAKSQPDRICYLAGPKTHYNGESGSRSADLRAKSMFLGAQKELGGVPLLGIIRNNSPNELLASRTRTEALRVVWER